MQLPTAVWWAIPGFCEFLGLSSDAVGFSVPLGYVAASLGEWYPTFQDGVVVSKRQASIAQRCGAAARHEFHGSYQEPRLAGWHSPVPVYSKQYTCPTVIHTDLCNLNLNKSKIFLFKKGVRPNKIRKTDSARLHNRSSKQTKEYLLSSIKKP
jgi:hypothetical protein